MRNLLATDTEDRVTAIFEKLVYKSIDKYYNPYKDFQWADTLPEDKLWMSPQLLSIYNVIPFETLKEEQVLALGKWESINFYSINVHGIRELLTTVLGIVYQPGYEQYSDYFNHFLGEENEHMWFFAQFCLRYGGAILPYRRFQFDDPYPPDIKNFMTFAQILIFEELGHYYNRAMMKDGTLPDIVCQINRVHYEDESRHISMGKTITEIFYRKITENHPPEKIAEVEDYLVRYMRYSVETLYSTLAYSRAGFDDSFALRRMLLEHPKRKAFHRMVFHNVLHFFETRLRFSQAIDL